MDIHVQRGEDALGEFTPKQATELLAEGRLLETDLAWHEGLEDWTTLGKLCGPNARSSEVEGAPPVFGQGRYQYEQLLGEGGMGQVWLAYDQQLERSVAVKLLHQHSATDERALRTLKEEVQKCLELTHPNIVRIYDLAEPPGEDAFISMEFVPGEDLFEKTKTQPEGRFEWRDIEPHILSLCDALEYAHGQGMVHRDLKPQNLIVTPSGELKLADFGIAAPAKGEGSEAASVPRAGTPVYWSPQQAQGIPPEPTDDIYSLGVTLYHLLVGEAPFLGASEPEITRQHIHDAPVPPQEKLTTRGSQGKIPPYLSELILKCLSKDLAQRPQTAGEVRDWIRAQGDPAKKRRKRLALAASLATLTLAAAVGATIILTPKPDPPPAPGPAAKAKAKPKPDFNPPTNSIVVLPFENLGGIRENQTFTDGMTWMTTQCLGRVRTMRVTSRTTAMQYRGTTNTVAEIGRQLNVAWVLAGSVQREGGQVRVFTELIDTRVDRQVWSQDYVRPENDSLPLQSELAKKIVQSLQTTLTPEERKFIDHQPTESFEAYQLFTAGRGQMRRQTGESLLQAVTLFEKALALDNQFAHAHAGLAEAWIFLCGLHKIDPAVSLPKAKAAAQRALVLNPGLSNAHVALAFMLWSLEGKTIEAMKHLELALDLSPSNARAHQLYAMCLNGQAWLDLALWHTDRALALAPSDVFVITQFASIITAVNPGRVSEARQRVLELLKTHPDNQPLLVQAFTLVSKVDREAGQEFFRRMAKLYPDNYDVIFSKMLAAKTRGDEAYLIRMIGELEQKYETEYVPLLAMINVYHTFQDVAPNGRARLIHWVKQAQADPQGFKALRPLTHQRKVELAQRRRDTPHLYWPEVASVLDEVDQQTSVLPDSPSLRRMREQHDLQLQKAKQGDSAAQFAVGRYLYSAKQYTQALPQIEAAAAQGHVHAQYLRALGRMDGLMGEQDLEAAQTQFAEAVPGLKQAAQNGDGLAARYLAIMHIKGWGVSQDLEQSWQWYEQAAEAGDDESQFVLGQRLALGPPASQDRPRGIQLLDQAASSGHGSAQFQLGMELIQDPRQATEAVKARAFGLFSKAILNGEVKAAKYKQMLRTNSNFALDPQQCLMLERKARKEMGLWVFEENRKFK